MITGFEQKDLPVLNATIDDLQRRLSKIDRTTPTVEVDETKFSHKIPITIGGVQYYIMLTAT